MPANEPRRPDAARLHPLDEPLVAVLTAALRSHGLELARGSARHGQLRLRLRGRDDGIELVVVPRDDRAPALARTERFDVSYMTPADVAAEGRGVRAARTLAGALRTPGIEALVSEALDRDARRRPRPLEAISPVKVASDAVFRPAAEPSQFAGFDVRTCRRGSDVPPRVLGSGALLLAGDRGWGLWRADPDPAPAGALARTRKALGRAFVPLPDGVAELRLAPRCRECARAHACAGCFSAAAGSDSADGARSHTSVEAGERLTVPASVLASGSGLRGLADRIAALPEGATVVISGRAPQAVLLQGNPPATLAEAAPPMEVAAVARALLGTCLHLRGYRLPGRHDAVSWELRYEVLCSVASSAVLRHVTVIANRRCVTVCRYCNLPLRLRENMPLRDTLAAIEEAAVLGAEALEVFGGEVTLRADLIAILAFARHLGLDMLVSTTAVGLSDDDLRALAEAKISDLSISLDSADPEVHDDLKNRPGMHATAVRAARILVELGARAVSLNTVITPLNYRGLPAVVELAAELGLSGVTCFLCQPIAEIGLETPLLSEEQAAELLGEIVPRCVELGRERGLDVGIRPAMHLEGAPAVIAARVGRGIYSRIFETGASCRVCQSLVSVQPGGEVRLCNLPLTQFEAEAVVGNLGDATLLEVLRSPAAAAYRETAGQRPECRWCTFDHPAAESSA